MAKEQEVYNRIIRNKEEMKKNKDFLSEQYAKPKEYQDIVVEIKKLREKKKALENIVKRDNANVMAKIGDLKIDIDSDQELLSDMILTATMRGETVELEGKNKQMMLPIFKVKMAKAT